MTRSKGTLLADTAAIVGSATTKLVGGRQPGCTGRELAAPQWSVQVCRADDEAAFASEGKRATDADRRAVEVDRW